MFPLQISSSNEMEKMKLVASPYERYLSGTKSKSVPHKKNDSSNKNKGVPLVPAGASLLGRNWDN